MISSETCRAMCMNNLYHNKIAQWIAYAVFFAALAAIPLYVDDSFLLNQFATYGIYAMLAMSISLCWGFGGILNLGQGIAFGLAAYGMAMTMQMQSQDPESNPIPPFMLNNSLDQLPYLLGAVLAHRPRHLPRSGRADTVLRDLRQRDVPRPRLRSVLRDPVARHAERALYHHPRHAALYQRGERHHAADAAGRSPVSRSIPTAPSPIGSCSRCWSSPRWRRKLVTQSSFGLIVQAVRGDAERVRFLGYNVAAYETVVYTLSGFIAAIAGCLWVMLLQYVSPAQLDATFSVSMVIWAAIGGRMSLLGAIMGALTIQGAQSYLGDSFLATWLLILGSFFILVVRFAPKGLAGLLESALGLFARDGKAADPGSVPSGAEAKPMAGGVRGRR